MDKIFEIFQIFATSSLSQLLQSIQMTVFHKTSRLLFAAFAPAHKLLPVQPSRDFQDLSALLRKAGIARVAFLRHGKTAPSTGVDFDRLLTDEGRHQAKQAGLAFGKDLNPYFSTALVSSAPRTVETAEIFLESCDARTTISPNDVLYDGTMQPKGSELFKQIGYAPLSSYLENDDDEIRQASQQILGAYANSCVETIMDTVAASTGKPPRIPDASLLIVGHAVYLPAAALAVSSLVDCPTTQDVILHTNTIEAEGYLVDIETKEVTPLTRSTSSLSL